MRLKNGQTPEHSERGVSQAEDSRVYLALTLDLVESQILKVQRKREFELRSQQVCKRQDESHNQQNKD